MIVPKTQSALQRGWRQVLTLFVAGALAFSAAHAARAEETPKIEMTVEMPAKKKGVITIELLPKDAPETVKHILDLVGKKHYDGVLFHRLVPGFVIQGGNPNTKKADQKFVRETDWRQLNIKEEGSGKTVPLEAKASHQKGTVGLARSQDPNSGDNQFFFNLADNLQLDSGYCVFGKVTKGWDVVEKLRQGDRILSVVLVKAGGKAPAKPAPKKKP